jgi:malate dehydrogenase (oxaloacetate-decarboxylating)
MLVEGAKRLAKLSPAIQASARLETSEQYEYNGEALLPDFGVAPVVNFEVGIAVAEQAAREGMAGASWLSNGDGVVQPLIGMMAKENVWVPVYHEYVYDEHGILD